MSVTIVGALSMLKGVKFRIYPNKEQIALLQKTFGCCRLVYNHGLSLRIKAYEDGQKIGYKETSAMLTEMKRCTDFSFLKEVDSIALQQALRDLDKAYKNFFVKRAGFPKFKSKHHHHYHYRTQNIKGNIRVAGGYIKLPKLGYVKAKISMPVNGTISGATLERTPSGKYFCSLTVNTEMPTYQNLGGVVGLDMGIKEFYTDSNGDVLSNPKYLSTSMSKLVKEQRKLSRKQKGSSNYKKQRIKLARIHEKITNQRNDFLHKASTKLVRENQIICLEDLHVKGMVRNHKLAPSISDVSWSRFVSMLEYKSLYYGTELIRVPRYYASSQICSFCGTQNNSVKNLAIRSWTCSCCRTTHDRDKNAAINIRNKGLQLKYDCIA